MGYTRYWKRSEKPITEDFVEEVRDIIRTSAKKGIAIRNAFGVDNPVITLNEISFNGNARADKDLSHESFVLDNTRFGFDFCKTARKPYDYTVRKVLRAAERHGLVYDVNSDGRNEQIYTDEEYIKGMVKWK